MTSGWSYKGRTVWRIFDGDRERARVEGMQPVLGGPGEELLWNNQGYAIVATVQSYLPGDPRRKANCQGILAWAVDLDGGDKPAQQARIKRAWRDHGLRPSSIIESKNGYHVYFNAEPGQSFETFIEIMDRMVELFDGDTQAKDLARTLRVPDHCHLKDPNDPFLVTQIYETTTRYSEGEMLAKLPPLRSGQADQRGRKELSRALSFQGDGGLFDRLWSMDQMAALNRLSGSSAVCGERYSFKGSGSRGYRIEVNGQPSSCWIDVNGKIGSLTGGGPTVWQWVNWLHRDHKRTYSLLRECLPEVFRDGR